MEDSEIEVDSIELIALSDDYGSAILRAASPCRPMKAGSIAIREVHLDPNADRDLVAAGVMRRP